MTSSEILVCVKQDLRKHPIETWDVKLLTFSTVFSLKRFLKYNIWFFESPTSTRQKIWLTDLNDNDLCPLDEKDQNELAQIIKRVLPEIKEKILKKEKDEIKEKTCRVFGIFD